MRRSTLRFRMPALLGLVAAFAIVSMGTFTTSAMAAIAFDTPRLVLQQDQLVVFSVVSDRTDKGLTVKHASMTANGDAKILAAITDFKHGPAILLTPRVDMLAFVDQNDTIARTMATGLADADGDLAKRRANVATYIKAMALYRVGFYRVRNGAHRNI